MRYHCRAIIFFGLAALAGMLGEGCASAGTNGSTASNFSNVAVNSNAGPQRFPNASLSGMHSDKLAASVSSDSNASAEDLLTRDLMTAVKPLPREIHLYHYFGEPRDPNRPPGYRSSTPAIRMDFARQYITSVTGRFWDLNYHPKDFVNAGPGIYLAVDPYVAFADRLYGNEMLELVVPAGTLSLNVVTPVPISTDTMAALIREKLITAKQAPTLFFRSARSPTGVGFYRDTLKVMMMPGFEGVRSMFLRIVQKAGFEFIEYPWKSALDGFCKFVRQPYGQSAFNYIGTSPYNGRYTGISYIPSVPYGEPTAYEQELEARSHKFRSLLEQIHTYVSRGRGLPKGLIVPQTYTQDEYIQMKAMTYSCE